MTREQHRLPIMASASKMAKFAEPWYDMKLADSWKRMVRVPISHAVAAAHHALASLRCEACEGEGEFPGHPVDYTERCTDCDGTGWRSL